MNKYRPIFDVPPLFSPLTRPLLHSYTRPGSAEELRVVRMRVLIKQVCQEMDRISVEDLRKFACQTRKS